MIHLTIPGVTISYFNIILLLCLALQFFKQLIIFTIVATAIASAQQITSPPQPATPLGRHPRGVAGWGRD